MNKCSGCGVKLQNVNSNELGFVKDLNQDLCERCFRIKYYNDYKKVLKDNDYVINILKKIEEDALVVLLIDLTNIPESLELIKNLKNKILLVFSKVDLIPSEMYGSKLNNIIKYLGINYVDKIVISSIKNTNLDELMLKINKYKTSKNVYFVGFSNSGKSTLINKIIYNYTDFKSEITTSILPSTTLDLIKVNINEKLTIIDTPGLIEENNLLDGIEKEKIKKIRIDKRIKPKVYQIKKPLVLNVDDILEIETDNNLVFYISNNLKIKKEFNKKINGLEFELNNEDLVISGLGFISFKDKTHVIIKTPYKVNIYKRKSLKI